jgi:hypothetical protein
MKKYILILAILLTASCASRKVNIEKIDIKKDSIVETKVTVTTIENKEKTDSTNIVTTIDNSEITITPIDTCKEIVVEGKVYKNVVLKIKKNKVNTLYVNNKRESDIKRIDSVAVVKVNKTERVVGKTKTIDKAANYWWLIWLFILILILYLLWRNRMWILRRL